MLPLHVKEQSPSGLHGFPEPEPLPPFVDLTGCLDGYAVWIGHIRIKTFTNLTLATRAATRLREALTHSCLTSPTSAAFSSGAQGTKAS